MDEKRGYYSFEYMECEGEIKSVWEAEIDYGDEGVEEKCSDILLEIRVLGSGFGDARKKMIELLPRIIDYEREKR